MTQILIAPTESPYLREIGKTSLLPERFGLDVMWWANGEKWGVQRKEVKDLRASAEDGRLGKEIAQARAANIKFVVVVEGKVRWSSEGVILDGFGRPWNRAAWWNLQLSIQETGGWIIQTDGLAGTVEFIQGYKAWTEKSGHNGLMGRPGPKGVWGTSATNRDWGVHVLCGFPGMGPELAGRLFDVEGRVPLTWAIDRGKMESVKGLGKKRIGQLIKTLEGP